MVTAEGDHQRSQSQRDEGVDSQPPFRFTLNEVKNPEPQPLTLNLHGSSSPYCKRSQKRRYPLVADRRSRKILENYGLFSRLFPTPHCVNDGVGGRGNAEVSKR